MASDSSFPTFIALDFDGVICDSARELFFSARRAATEIWPEHFSEGVNSQELPVFRKLRSYLEYGYQALVLCLLGRIMVVAGGSSELDFTTLSQESLGDISSSIKKIASVQASVPDALEKLVSMTLRDVKGASDLLKTGLSRSRSEFISANHQDWLNQHELFSHIHSAILGWHRKGYHLVVISTKSKTLLQDLVLHFGLPIASHDLYGLEDGPKEETLMELTSDWQKRYSRTIFVEDRLATLERVTSEERLKHLELYLAGWGYVTQVDLNRARGHSQIQTLKLNQMTHIW